MDRETNNVAGKVVVITGASSGLGASSQGSGRRLGAVTVAGELRSGNWARNTTVQETVVHSCG